jgi:hypothetical protein
MLATNPLIAYGVERATRLEPVQLVGSERVVAEEFEAASIGFGEPTADVAAGCERGELAHAESVVLVDVVVG